MRLCGRQNKLIGGEIRYREQILATTTQQRRSTAQRTRFRNISTDQILYPNLVARLPGLPLF